MFPRDPTEIRLDDWVDHVCNAIVRPDLHDVVLVGHSLAGITLPRVVDRIADRIAHQVYIAAIVPAEGQSVADLVMGGATPPAVLPAPDVETAHALFCNDMDARQQKYVTGNLVPEAGQPFTVPMDLAGLRHPVPRTFVRPLRDQTLPAERLDEIIARLEPVEVTEVDAGHDLMISKPAALAPVLNALTRS